jgi:hypothetical protein
MKPYDKPIKTGFQDFFLLKGKNFTSSYAASNNRWDLWFFFCTFSL